MELEFAVQLALQVLAPSGVAAYAVKAALNGSRERIKDTHEDVKELREDIRALRNDYHTVLARLYVVEIKSGVRSDP